MHRLRKHSKREPLRRPSLSRGGSETIVPLRGKEGASSDAPEVADTSKPQIQGLPNVQSGFFINVVRCRFEV